MGIYKILKKVRSNFLQNTLLDFENKSTFLVFWTPGGVSRAVSLVAGADAFKQLVDKPEKKRKKGKDFFRTNAELSKYTQPLSLYLLHLPQDNLCTQEDGPAGFLVDGHGGWTGEGFPAEYGGERCDEAADELKKLRKVCYLERKDSAS